MYELMCFCNCGRRKSYSMGDGSSVSTTSAAVESIEVKQVSSLKHVVTIEQADTPNESIGTPVNIAAASNMAAGGSAANTSVIGDGNVTEDEGGEEDLAVDMPPPMEEIQTHPLPGQSPPPMEAQDVHAKLTATLSGKTQSDTASASDLALEIENIVKHRLSDGQQGSEDTEGTDKEETDGQEAESSEATPTEEGEVLSEEEANRRKYMQKRHYVIKELANTEKDYVHDLGLLVEGYMEELKEMTLPEGMEGKDKIVFGNVHQIYEWHKETFFDEIIKCGDEPQRIGLLFTKYERRLYMYVTYCRNKPMSEYIVAEYIDFFESIRQKLGHRLGLPDLLIKPVQRIMKYQLLLKDILKYTEKAGEDTKEVQRAVQVMLVVPKAANDMMNVGRLQGFTGKISSQGRLLLQDTLLVMEMSKNVEAPKLKERHLFLFEQLLIFSEETEKKKNSLTQPSYIYKNSVKFNNMSLDDKGGSEPHSFLIVDRTPGSDLKFLVQCPSDEVKQNWVTQIKSILHLLTDILTALQCPIAYQKELTKELSAPEFGGGPSASSTQKNSMLRKTQSQPHSQQKVKRQNSDKTLGVKVKDSHHGRKSSCPSSPTSDKPKKKKVPTATLR